MAETSYLQEFYKNELKFVANSIVSVFTHGKCQDFRDVKTFHVTCPSPGIEILVIETVVGKVVFRNWDGVMIWFGGTGPTDFVVG